MSGKKSSKKIKAVEKKVLTSLKDIFPGAFTRLSELLNDPDLMELEIKYVRDNEVELKAMLDHVPDTSVIHEIWEGDTAKLQTLKSVPYCENMGTGPAGEVYDAIELGK